MLRLTRRTNSGHAIPARCKDKDGCDKPHCDDCYYIGEDAIRAIIEKLCRYEETGLEFPKEDDE
jgi:hypothetical protein